MWLFPNATLQESIKFGNSYWDTASHGGSPESSPVFKAFLRRPERSHKAITCKVPNPYSTKKLIWQNIFRGLRSIRITHLIYNYLVVKSVTISLWDKYPPAFQQPASLRARASLYSGATLIERLSNSSDLNPDNSLWRSAPCQWTSIWDGGDKHKKPSVNLSNSPPKVCPPTHLMVGS